MSESLSFIEKSASSKVLPLARGVCFSTLRKQVSFNLYKTRFLLNPSTLPTPTHPVYPTGGSTAPWVGAYLSRTLNTGGTTGLMTLVVLSNRADDPTCSKGVAIGLMTLIAWGTYLWIACSRRHLLGSSPSGSREFEAGTASARRDLFI